MRMRRKSIGGISDTSADVQTATTPGSASAALVSIDTMRPWAWAERTTRIWTMRGKATSAANRPRPVTRGRSSTRVTDRPTKAMSGLYPRGRRTQRGADALWRCRKLIDRDAKRRQGVVNGIDDGGRRPDCTALAQPLGLGDRSFGQGFQMVDLDGRNLTRGRRQVVRQRCREDVARLIVDDLFEQGVGDALGDTAVNLPVHDHRVDQSSGILGHQKLFDHDAAGLDVDLDHSDVARIGKRSGRIVGGALGNAGADLTLEPVGLMIGG